MKTLISFSVALSFALGFTFGLWINTNTEYTVLAPTSVAPKTPTTLELSVGGKVKVLKFSPTDTIHVIADDDLKLTDIQVIPLVFTPHESPNQITEVSRSKSEKSP